MGHDGWHLGHGAAFDEFLKSAELRHMKLRIGHPPALIQVYRDPRVPFDPRHAIYHNRFRHQFLEFTTFQTRPAEPRP